MVEGMTQDLKHDLLLAFDIYKNDENKINKLKLRTLLFSFAMYKSSAKDINDFISDNFPKQEEFTYNDLCKLVQVKLKYTKEKEAEDLFFCINNGKGQNYFTKEELLNIFESNDVDLSEKEINEMISFMTGKQGDYDNIHISKEEFKKFFI